MIIKVRPTAYMVTLMPISVKEPQIQKSSPMQVPQEESIKSTEKIKPIEKPHKDDIVEKVKKPPKDSSKRLLEPLEEIRKKAALDEIKKRIARREQEGERPAATASIKTLPVMESKLNEYYSLVWTKVGGAWTIPENLIKEIVDLETIIVVIIERNGKIQNWWFEKNLAMASTIRVQCEPLKNRTLTSCSQKIEWRHP